jgi:hypothetical protein
MDSTTQKKNKKNLKDLAEKINNELVKDDGVSKFE